MLGSFSNKAILTKARAMYGRRLKPADYDEMLRKRSVSELAAYLKGTESYGPALSHINAASIHRGQLEALLRRDLFHKYTRLCRYDFSKENSFYSYVVLSKEIDEILRCIMFVNAKEPERFIADLPSFLLEHASFDLMSLADVWDYAGLVAALKSTPYAKIIERFPPGPDGMVDYTACETALRTYYYQRLFAMTQHSFRGRTKRELRNIFLLQIELLNLSVIFRLKIYFKKSKEEIQPFLLPFHYKLHRSTLDRLMEARNADGFMDQFFAIRYGKHLAASDYTYIENYSMRLYYLFEKQLIRFSVNAPCALCAFMALSEIEVTNIVNIIERRYSVPPNDIQKLLII